MFFRSVAVIAFAVSVCLPARAEPELAGIDPAQSTTRLGDAPVEAAIPAILGLRMGRHGARTRVVLDMAGRPDFEHRTTASGRSVMVSFQAVDWQAPKRPPKTAGVVSKVLFGAGEGGRGDMAIIAAAPVKVAKAFAIEPDTETGRWRVVLDLIPLDALSPEERADALAPAKPAPTFGTLTVKLAE